ncbi:hypothetical protein Tco_0388585 [Tanacetum coccineum]
MTASARTDSNADLEDSPYDGSDDGLGDTLLISPFPHSNNDSDDEEVLNELSEHENAKTLRRERIINSFDGDDLAFECMVGFRKFTAYLDPFLPMNIISHKAYNTIMVDRLERTGKNILAIVRDVYAFVRSFTYITDFVVLEDIGEFIMSDMAEVLMGRTFRKTTRLKYDVTKGLVSFTKIFDTYTYRMLRTIPRLKNFNWSKVPPLLELSQNDLMSGFRHSHEKNKFMYKNCLYLCPEYQVNESMKEWHIHGHMKEGYGDGDVTLYPAQVFSVNNWALKPNQPEEPPFTDHMLAIYYAAKLVVIKAPKLSSNVERVLKAPTGSKTGHLKKKKYSSSTMESNPSQTSISTHVVIEMHKEDQQATGGPNYLGVTSEERADPQLSNGMSTFNLNKPICSASFNIHSESASGYNDSADSIAEADPGLSAPNDFIPQQQGASSIARQVKEEEASRIIKLEDLAKLVLHVQPSFKDLDLPKDDPIIVVDDSDEDKEADKDEVHTIINDETEDASSQKHKLELEKNKAEAALFRAQPSFPNMGQLNELLVKYLQTEFSKILSAHDFSSSLPTELKELPFKFNELTKEVKGLKKQVHNLEIELPRELKEIPTKLKDFTKTVTSLTSQVAELKTLQWELPAVFLSVPIQVEVIQAKLKTLDALSSLLHKVTNALNQFAQAIALNKTKNDSVSSAGQAGTQPAEGEKNTNQATISQLFQRKAAKNANLTKQ